MLAITNAERVVRILARPLHWFEVVSAPFTIALNAISNGIVRLFGVDPHDLGEKHTSADLKEIIQTSAKGGTLDPGEAVMLGGVFHLHEQRGARGDDPDPRGGHRERRRDGRGGAAPLRLAPATPGWSWSRTTTPTRSAGIVHNNSLVRLYMNAGPDASLEPAIREVPVFPETKPLDDLLAELQRQRSSIGIVSDEYGRTVGIVTVEDILEEVVGEIEDETDPRATSLRRLTDGDWYVRGHVPLGDLEDAGIELPVASDAFNSIGGYVFSELGRLPKRGDKVRANGYELRVESVRDNRIVAVRIHAVTAEHRALPGELVASRPARPASSALPRRRPSVRGASIAFLRPRRRPRDGAHVGRQAHRQAARGTEGDAARRGSPRAGAAGGARGDGAGAVGRAPRRAAALGSVADEARRQGDLRGRGGLGLCGATRSRPRRAAPGR